MRTLDALFKQAQGGMRPQRCPSRRRGRLSLGIAQALQSLGTLSREHETLAYMAM